MAKTQADRIFDGIFDPDMDNFEMIEGELAGHQVFYIAAKQDEDDESQDIPVALILDKKTAKLLQELEAIAEGDEEDEEEGDEGEPDDEEENEEVEGASMRRSKPKPARGGKKFKL